MVSPRRPAEMISESSSYISFANGIRDLLILFIQNRTALENLSFTNKKANELAEFNNILFNTVEFEIFIQKIYQENYQKIIVEKKYDDFSRQQNLAYQLEQQKLYNKSFEIVDEKIRLIALIREELEAKMAELRNLIDKLRKDILYLQQAIAKLDKRIAMNKAIASGQLDQIFQNIINDLAINKKAFTFMHNNEAHNIDQEDFTRELKNHLVGKFQDGLNPKDLMEDIYKFSDLYLRKNFPDLNFTNDEVTRKLVSSVTSLMREQKGFAEFIETRNKIFEDERIIAINKVDLNNREKDIQRAIGVSSSIQNLTANSNPGDQNFPPNNGNQPDQNASEANAALLNDLQILNNEANTILVDAAAAENLLADLDDLFDLGMDMDLNAEAKAYPKENPIPEAQAPNMPPPPEVPNGPLGSSSQIMGMLKANQRGPAPSAPDDPNPAPAATRPPAYNPEYLVAKRERVAPPSERAKPHEEEKSPADNAGPSRRIGR